MPGRLILIPTAPEREILEPLLQPDLQPEDRVELCGFGLAAAGVRSGMLLERYRPREVLLVGIAGTFTDALSVGTAGFFDEVACRGIGVGTGKEHRTVGRLQWSHLGSLTADGGPRVGDTICIRREAPVQTLSAAGQLLSVTAASADAADAAICRQQFPSAVAEDMEGFSVALACRLAAVPLVIVRGISNRVGDRDRSAWKMSEALESAAALARSFLLPAG